MSGRGEKIWKNLICSNQKTNISNAIIKVNHPELNDYHLYCEGNPPLLFTDNETNTERVFGTVNQTPFVKDGINNYIVHGNRAAVNPNNTGTKASADYSVTIKPGKSAVIRLRLTNNPSDKFIPFGDNFDGIFDFHGRRMQIIFTAQSYLLHLGTDEVNVFRQALAGMMWSKQFYLYDIDKWLDEHGSDPSRNSGKTAIRNEEWHHMFNGDIISMPDKWEYPWYASWDLAFHVLALTLVDPDFGKQQLRLMMQGHYMHPNGMVPAYEWNFSDVNPPVLAWSTIFTYRLEKLTKNVEDTEWLKANFMKLLLNFTWWVNARTVPAEMCLMVDSSGWITLGYSTEVHRFLPVDILNRQMVLHGWLSSARICWK